MKILLNTKYIINTEAIVKFTRYNNGSTALLLVDLDGSPLCTASVNFDDGVPQPNEIFVKNWSENEGLEQCLIAQNIIESEPFGCIEFGYIVANLYKLTDTANIERIRQQAMQSTEEF